MKRHVTVWPADPRSTGVEVRRGRSLLRGVGEGPSLQAHLRTHGPIPRLGLDELTARTRGAGLLGKGGAGFPFAVKLEAVARSRGRAQVVVNLAEGEPASWKDSSLALTAPHLVLDGASIAATALGAREIQIALPGDRPGVRLRMAEAIAERDTEQIRTEVADVAFVAGQAAAVIELLSGRENRPVTTWQPAAERGFRNKPTLLSNAETFAHVALLARGVDAGTTLLTLDGDGDRPLVREVRIGRPWHKVLTDDQLDGPMLLGGYHGTWARPGALRDLEVSRESMSSAGLTLGAGIVLTGRRCPLHRASEIATYLAAESAGRCGPCINGLPRLAATLRDAARGLGGLDELERLAGLVERRGACAHPDGTARMVRSLVAGYAEEFRLHQRGRCGFADGVRRRAS